MEKIVKQSNPKVMSLLRRKVNVKTFRFQLEDGETSVDRTTMDV